IWWQTDANAKVEAGKILAQTARIGDALDAIGRLVKGMDAPGDVREDAPIVRRQAAQALIQELPGEPGDRLVSVGGHAGAPLLLRRHALHEAFDGVEGIADACGLGQDLPGFDLGVRIRLPPDAAVDVPDHRREAVVLDTHRLDRSLTDHDVAP
ncbi:hypothetical protein, partial [Methylobacterium sp. WL116]|uniref:hypothetical protein n=1 Tax=Methylobacterium sp. WL116 TaxID=2603889 RepID=UPI00164EE344